MLLQGDRPISPGSHLEAVDGGEGRSNGPDELCILSYICHKNVDLTPGVQYINLSLLILQIKMWL